MADEDAVPFMLMRGTYGMIVPGPDGPMYYSPDPAGYRELPPDAGVQMIGGDVIIDGFDGDDPMGDDDGLPYLRE